MPNPGRRLQRTARPRRSTIPELVYNTQCTTVRARAASIPATESSPYKQASQSPGNADECRRGRTGRAGARSPEAASNYGPALEAVRPRGHVQSANKCARCRDAKEKKQTSSMLLQPPDFPWLPFATHSLPLSLSLSLSFPWLPFAMLSWSRSALARSGELRLPGQRESVERVSDQH
jgi:hypothetical protein